MRLDLLSRLNAERAARRAAILVTDPVSGEQRLVQEGEIENDPLARELQAALRQGKSGFVERDGRRYFLTVQAPPVKVIAGAARFVNR